MLLHALLAATLVAAPSPAQGAPPDERPRALFLTHCATCHGETGDGKGVTELDRPARSFLAGGFSFGNTPEAIFRTVSTGIPGSPMPAFDSALSEAERRLVADYVISLGPEGAGAAPADTELVVGERAVVVRGMLPPIAERARERPRGLLVGLPDGLSLEYATDDVRLLGVRKGRFVDRRDWIGRGGDALAPLGQLVYLNEAGNPGAAFELAPAAGVGRGRELAPLRARLAGSWVRGEAAGLRYRLETDEGRLVATVEESVRTLASSVGAGFARRYVLEAPADAQRATLVPRTLFPPRGGAPELDLGVFSGETRGEPGSLASGQVRYAVTRREGELRDVWICALAPWLEERRLERGPRMVLALVPGERVVLEDALVTTRGWAPETRASLARELFP